MIGVIKALTGNIQVTWSSPRQNANTDAISNQAKGLCLFIAVAPLLVAVNFLS